MTAAFSPTLALAEFAARLRLEDAPAEAVAGAKLLFLDTIGVALAAVPEALGQTITGYVRDLGGAGRSTVLGARFQTAPPLAALANGTLASAQDFDAGFHLTTHTIPAALAAAEHAGASGASVLEGVVVGYEAGARLTEILDSARGEGGGVTGRGWYHVGLVGPIVSALAAGKLLGLSPQQLAQAVGIAASGSGGIRRNFGTMAKAYQAGQASSEGVQAAMLAARGFTGDPEILEAPLGLLQALGAQAGAGTEATLSKLGRVFELQAPLRIKRFPACTPAHRPIQAVLALRRQHQFGPDDVQRIEADLHTFSLLRLDPADEVAAGFSLPYLLAAAVVDGEVGLEQVRPERVHDEAVRAVMARVTPLGDSAPSGSDEGAETVRVHLRDGRVLEGQVRGVARLDSPDEVEAKFMSCASRVLSPRGAQQVIAVVKRLNSLDNLAELTSSIAAQVEA